MPLATNDFQYGMKEAREYISSHLVGKETHRR